MAVDAIQIDRQKIGMQWDGRVCAVNYMGHNCRTQVLSVSM
jgi:hypothetical protein